MSTIVLLLCEVFTGIRPPWFVNVAICADILLLLMWVTA